MVYETWLLVTCSPLLPAILWIYQSRNVSLKPIPIFLLFFFNFKPSSLQCHIISGIVVFFDFCLSLPCLWWGETEVGLLFDGFFTPRSSRCPPLMSYDLHHGADANHQPMQPCAFHFINKQCRSLLYLKRLISEDIAQLFTPEVSTTSTSPQFHWHRYQCILFATC